MTFGEVRWRRLHPLSPVLKGGLVFIIVAGVLIANLRDHFLTLMMPFFFGDLQSEGGTAQRPGQDDDLDEVIAEFEFEFNGDLWGILAKNGLVLIVLAAILGVVLLVLLLTWVAWRYHTFRITPEAVEVRKGVVFRSHRRAPLERIQSVNLQRPLLARLLGLTKIDIQTAGQSGSVELSYLGHAEAQRVRDEILSSAGRTSATGIRFDVSREEEVHETATIRVPVARLLAATFLGHEVIIFVLLITAIIIATVFFGWGALAFVIPGMIALGSITFGRFNKGFRFTISGSKNSVRTGSGLTATSTETIPLRRIHAVDIMQPLWWRPFGWWRVRVTTAGGKPGSNTNNQNMFQNVLLPVGNSAEVDELMLMLGMVSTDTPTVWEHLEGSLGAPKRAWPVLLFGLKHMNVALAHQPGSHVRQLRIRRGFFTRHIVLMPLQRAQSVDISRPIGHYFAGLARVQVHTVMGPVSVTVRGLSHEHGKLVFLATSDAILEAQRADIR